MTSSRRRLVDYFFVAGLTEEALLSVADPSAAHGERAGAGADAGTGGAADATVPTGGPTDLHPIFRNFRAQTLWRYPLDDHADYKYNKELPSFCFPTYIQVKQVNAKTGVPQTTYHSFSLTDEYGVKSFGFAIILNEPMEPSTEEKLRNKFKYGVPEPEMRVFINALLQKIAKVEQEIDEHKAELGKVDPNDAKATKLIEGKIRDCEDTIQLHTTILGEYHKDVNQNNLAMYLPKAVCIVSHYPFYDFFRDYLSQLVWSCQNGLLLPLERYVVNITSEIPLPPAGKDEVAVTLDHVVLYLSRPPRNHLPMLKNFSFHPIFRLMSLENIVTLVEAMLSERKIMFYSKNLVTLNLAAETVAALIYPFSWHMPWLPCLPVDTIIDGDLLESPVPIVCGLHSQMRTLFTLPSEFVVADLDANLVTAEEPVRRLPSEDRKRLIESLKKHANLTLPSGVESPSIFTPILYNKKCTLVSTKSSLSIPGYETYAHRNGIPETVTLQLYKKSPTVARNVDSGAASSTSNDALSTSVSSSDVSSPLSDKLLPPSPIGGARPANSFLRVQPTRASSTVPVDTRMSADIGMILNGAIQAQTGNSSFYASASDSASSSQASSSDISASRVDLVSDKPNLAPVNQQPLSGPFLGVKELSLWNETMIQDSFLKMYVSWFKEYRRHIVPASVPFDPNQELFKRDIFLTVSKTAERREYLAEFINSQMVTQFMHERAMGIETDHEILYFDECIKVKKNRKSKLFTSKEPTPFINDKDTFKISKRVVADEPNRSGIPDSATYVYDRFPTTFDESLALHPRPYKELVTDKDERQLKLHTSAIVRKERLKHEKSSKRKNNVIMVPRLMTDEERKVEFDKRLDQVYVQLTKWAISDDQLPQKSDAYIEVVCSILETQLQILIKATNDEELVNTRDDQEHLTETLQQIMLDMAKYQEHLKARHKR